MECRAACSFNLIFDKGSNPSPICFFLDNNIYITEYDDDELNHYMSGFSNEELEANFGFSMN